MGQKRYTIIVEDPDTGEEVHRTSFVTDGSETIEPEIIDAIKEYESSEDVE